MWRGNVFDEEFESNDRARLLMEKISARILIDFFLEFPIMLNFISLMSLWNFNNIVTTYFTYAYLNFEPMK